MRRLLIAATVLLAAACGDEKLRVEPPTARLAPGQALQFEVRPTGVPVAWSVQEAGGGSVDASGLYTAPATWGTYHVVATAAPTVQASATVTVESPVAITAPSPQTADACVAKQLTATVTGASDTSITWGGADPACGTLTPAGVFTPARNLVSCVVAAQANADPTKVVQVTVNVTPERVLGVAVVPATATVPARGTQQFAATVTTTCGTFPAGG